MKVGAIGSFYAPNVKRNSSPSKNPAFKADVRVATCLVRSDKITLEQEKEFNKVLEDAKTELADLGNDNVLILLTPVVKKKTFGKDKLDVDVTAMFKDLEKGKKELEQSLTKRQNGYDIDLELLREYPELCIKEKLTNARHGCTLYECFENIKRSVPALQDIKEFAKGHVNSLYLGLDPLFTDKIFNVQRDTSFKVKFGPEYDPNIDLPPY